MHKLFYSISAVVILISLTLALTGCGKKSISDKLIIWNASEPKEAWQPLLDAYGKKNKTEIEYVHKTAWENDPWLYETELLNALATGQGPDIVTIRNDWIPKHFDKAMPAPDKIFGRQDKKLAKLTNLDYISQYFVPSVTQENVIDGKLYGLPFYVDSLALYCQPQIFSKALDELTAREHAQSTMSQTELRSAKQLLQNYPQTWQEVLRAIELIKITSGDNISRSAIALGEGTNVSSAPDIFAALLLQNNAQMITYDLKSAAFHLAQPNAATSFPGRDALSFYSRFADPADQYYTWNKNQPNSEQAFLDGNLAMVIADSSLQAKLQQKDSRRRPTIVGFPQISADNPRTIAHYWTNIVTTNSKNVEGAWDFLAYVSQQKILKDYLKLNKKPTPFLAGQEGDTSRDIFNSQSQYALGWYHGRQSLEAEKILTAMLDQAPTERGNLDKLLDTFANQFTAMLTGQTPPTGSGFSMPTK